MSPHVEESLQWRGNNFPELYEWLVRYSTTKNLKLKILSPGQPNSPIQVSLDRSISFKLSINDWIVRYDDGTYCVFDYAEYETLS